MALLKALPDPSLRFDPRKSPTLEFGHCLAMPVRRPVRDKREMNERTDAKMRPSHPRSLMPMGWTGGPIASAGAAGIGDSTGGAAGAFCAAPACGLPNAVDSSSNAAAAFNTP